MNREETANVVTYLVAAGKLQPVDGQAAVWHDALGALRYADAVEACREIAAGEGSWVTPGTVRAAVRRIRSGRIGNQVPPSPPPDVSASAQIDYQRAFLGALGDGLDRTEADRAACSQIGAQRFEEVERRRPIGELVAKVGRDA